MLDEEMDHIIREAANNHHPAYNDKAWEKMELQLDKHLPQKNDRRRLVFFLLFFLLLGAGTFLIINNRSNNGKSIVAEKNSGDKKASDGPTTEYVTQNPQTVKEQQSPVPENTEQNNNNSIPGVSQNKNKTGATVSKFTPQNEDNKSRNNFTDGLNNNDAVGTNTKQMTGSNLKPQKKNRKNTSEFITDLTNSDDEIATSGRRKTGSRSKTKIKISAAKPFEETQTGEDLADNRKPITGKTNSKLKVSIADPGTENGENAPTASVSTESKETTGEKIKAEKEVLKDPVKPAEDKKLTVDKKPVSSPDKKKSENKFKSNFGLTFSVGPDMSFVKLNNTGKTTLTYGAGISYGFAKRFTARAGFYVSKKVYQAAPDEYHTPGGNYPYLTDVDANCKVYEIPVSLSYSFGQRKKHNWFGSVGLSSFIMKKEDYVYNYKTPAGQTYTYYNGVSNENKHYFSVLTLSGGYQYQFNKKISIMAEPYFKLPLGGVGLGKIKLNSAGVLFTITVKPFAKSK